jgi:hypothetical protein
VGGSSEGSTSKSGHAFPPIAPDTQYINRIVYELFGRKMVLAICDYVLRAELHHASYIKSKAC